MSERRGVEQRSGSISENALEPGSVLVALGTAGIAGPVIFAGVALVQSLLRPDHSLVRHPISALAAGPSGWV